MLWLSSADETAPVLPAAWLIATAERPRNLPERSALRQAVGRRVLARQFGLPEQAVTLAHEPAGRPLIAAPPGTGLGLSLATRAGLVAVGLAHGPVGVDVEQIAPDGEPALSSCCINRNGRHCRICRRLPAPPVSRSSGAPRKPM